MIKIFDFFRFPTKPCTAAAIAKERLQIIVSHESANSSAIIKQLQTELIEVISKYVKVDQDQITVQLEHNGDHSVLELNVTLPDTLTSS